MANKAFTIKHGLNPSTDNSVDLGTSSLEFKDLYIDGTAFLDAIGFGSTAITLPSGAGNDGQVLKSNGSNALTWEDDTAGTITALNNQTADRLVTIGSTTTQLDGEPNLTFTGSILTVAGTTNTKQLNLSASGAALASQNAHKIILVDLTDPATMWGVEAFLARVRHTSWYEELGAPPMRGAIWITEAQTSMVWWNLDTDTQYIKFDTGGSSNADSNMLYFSSSNPPDSLVFLDGKIFYGVANSGGVWIIDFLRDDSTGWFASGQRRYSGTIKERNDGNGNVPTKSTAIVSNDVKGVAAVRDPLSFDEFDRPVHWWAIGTADRTDVYNPINDAIYQTDNNADSTDVFNASSQYIFEKQVWTGSYQCAVVIDPTRSYADNQRVNMWAACGVDHHRGDRGSWSSSATINDGAINADGTRVATATDEGLQISLPVYGANPNDNTIGSGKYWVTSTYNTPLIRGEALGTYPLNDVNDRSGNSHTLTNNNSTTFSSGPFGNAATFNGTNQYLHRASDSGFNITGTAGDTFTVSFYYKSTSATNPSSSTYLMAIERAAGAESLEFYFTTAGKVVMYANDGAGTGTITSDANTFDGEWHHVVGAIAFGDRSGPWKGGTHGAYGWMRMWVDGVYAGGVNWGNTNAFGTDALYVGTNEDATVFFAGQIAQLSICKGSSFQGVWSENDINLEYQRMMRGLGGATHTIANNNVKSVRIDQNSGLAAITTAANQTEIWDITTGLRESIDGTTTATVNDADVALKSGADDPEYITGRSGAIEYDGKARRVIG